MDDAMDGAIFLAVLAFFAVCYGVMLMTTIPYLVLGPQAVFGGKKRSQKFWFSWLVGPVAVFGYAIGRDLAYGWSKMLDLHPVSIAAITIECITLAAVLSYIIWFVVEFLDPGWHILPKAVLGSVGLCRKLLPRKEQLRKH